MIAKFTLIFAVIVLAQTLYFLVLQLRELASIKRAEKIIIDRLVIKRQTKSGGK